MLGIVSAVAVANVATSALYWVACRRLVADTASDTLATASNHVARVAADVSRVRDATRDLADVVVSLQDGLDTAPDGSASSTPVLLGGGSIRTASGALMLYMDYRFPDGSTERRYSRPIQRRSEGGAHSGAERPGASGTSPGTGNPQGLAPLAPVVGH